MRFWDSSAIVPLVVREAISSEVEGWLANDVEMAVWTLASTEVLSAIHRIVRQGNATPRTAIEAETRVHEMFSRASVVRDVELVKQTAARLLRMHNLRAADALQLGAALGWADGRPQGQVFVTLDRRLGQAAEREGFRIIPAV